MSDQCIAAGPLSSVHVVKVLLFYAPITFERPNLLQLLAVQGLLAGSLSPIPVLCIQQGRGLTWLQLIAHPASPKPLFCTIYTGSCCKMRLMQVDC